MSFINYAQREIILKIVYYGPGLCGKTTNIKFIYSGTNPDARGKLISLETKQERTLFFDFLPLSLPSIRGFKTRLHLYSVPGQLFYSASRKLIMKGADGVIFVADSQRARKEANIISMEDLKENLLAYGYDIDKIPFCIQYNKRDLPTAMPLEELRQDLNSQGKYPEFEACAVAPDGPGVFDTLKSVVKMILMELKKGQMTPPMLAPHFSSAPILSRRAGDFFCHPLSLLLHHRPGPGPHPASRLVNEVRGP